jgi:hypothetical protein
MARRLRGNQSIAPLLKRLHAAKARTAQRAIPSWRILFSKMATLG